MLRQSKRAKNNRFWIVRGLLTAILSVASVHIVPALLADEFPDKHRVSVAVARDRAKTSHEIYAATLESLHHFYFHGDRAAVPAKVMEDIFAESQRQTKIEARWISVSLKPMSINHEPKSNFEKLAAKEIAAGKPDYDAIEGGYYRRAGAIFLSGGCVSCHGGLTKGAEGKPQYAGLVISIPITGNAENKK